jgi:predicted phosphodiesterase
MQNIAESGAPEGTQMMTKPDRQEQITMMEHAEKIGLLADSHGNLMSIRRGVRRLYQAGVQALIHLGDIFDSQDNDDLYEIYTAVTRANILAVKGNNDFQVENLLAAGTGFDILSNEKIKILSYLKHMPMRLEDNNICYAHSLPFDSIRSFYEPIDTGTTERAADIFEKTTYSVLFCGHSHDSIMFRWAAGRVTREPIPSDETIFFDARERYIIIVGASDNGECGVFDKDRLCYQRIPITG